jgi:hypothetical protein
MNEILIFSFRNTSTNISIPNHISNYNDHIWHHIKSLQTTNIWFVSIRGKKKKKKKKILGSISKVNKVCIATQVSDQVLT